jgi:farnesyl diphosphate synthase
MPAMELDAGSEFALRLKQNAADVSAMIDALLQPRLAPEELARPPRLLAAMRYSCLDGGKRLRPFLVIETARLFGAAGEGVLRAAAAVEMLHCYSLAHDDLPAMDDDDFRRGRPSLHKAFDEATAILTGDALQTLAFDTLADAATHPLPEVRTELVLGLARASGLGGMAGGQALDLEAEQNSTPLTEPQITLLQSMKTGALLRFSVEAGAVMGGADPAARSALNSYGRALGAAFQIADDILDVEGDSETMGKRSGKDMQRNKATLVSAMGVEAARQRCADHVSDAIAALRGAGGERNTGMLAQAAV